MSPPCPPVSDTSDPSDEQTGSIAPKQPSSQPTDPHLTPQLTYSSGAISERRTLLKTWLASVIGTAVAFALVSGIKDVRARLTTSMSAGSIAFVVTALGNSKGNK